jgi:hypothetical protein
LRQKKGVKGSAYGSSWSDALLPVGADPVVAVERMGSVSPLLSSACKCFDEIVNIGGLK